MKQQKLVKRIVGGLLVVAAVLSSHNLSAQKNLSLYSLSNTPQSLMLNPASKVEYKMYLGLPLGMQNISLMNTGFRISDAIETRPQDDSLLINPQLAVDKMAKINYVNVETCNSLFGFGLRVGKNYFSFDVTAKTQFRFTYPRGLFEFAVEGNGGDNLGQRISLDGIAIDVMSYSEFAFGFQRQLTEKLTVGGRFKLLSGIANVQTRESRLGISTDSTTFDITIDGQAALNSSNVSPFYDKTYEETHGQKYNPAAAAYNFGNSGVAIDAGMTYQASEKLRIDASMIDFGFIRWKSNISNYRTNDFNYTFRGIDFNQASVDSNATMDRFVDSLKSAFGNEETHDAYTTSLYTRFIVGGQLEVTKFFTLTALLYNEIAASRYSPGLSFAGTLKAGKWLQASLSYSMYGRSYGNVGIALAVRPGPVQFYISTDNIFGLLDPAIGNLIDQSGDNAPAILMLPAYSKYMQIAFGMNVLIGKGEKEAKTKKAKKSKDDKATP